MEAYGAKPLVDVDHSIQGGGPRPEPRPSVRMNTGDVGILKCTLLPSLTLNTGLSLVSYAAARATDRVEVKDYNWPASQVANAWWSAIGRHMYHDHMPFTTAWNILPWTEKLLLSSVTLWGTRLFYRIVSRSVARGKDDPRYDELKEQQQQQQQQGQGKGLSGFWNSALLKWFLPEAAVLTLVSLPFTLPFRMGSSTVSFEPQVSCGLRTLGVGLFSAGFAMETLADAQLESHSREGSGLCRRGVWSIVRHPNYLGDSLVHFSFILLNAANTFNPFVLLGPLVNYAFLRFIGGDKMTEESQECRYSSKDPSKYKQLKIWQSEKNSFWPSLTELANPWTWIILGSGALGVAVEEGLRSFA